MDTRAIILIQQVVSLTRDWETEDIVAVCFNILFNSAIRQDLSRDFIIQACREFATDLELKETVH